MPRKKVVELPKKPEGTPITDLYYAAYLVALGVRMLGTTREGHRTTFYFESSEAKFRAGWYDGSGVVSGLNFSNALRNLKSLVANTV
jgi:hypothetical protein